MKVILLKDVRDIGRAHETVSVSDGHALNFLIPRKFAVAATEAAAKQATARKAIASTRREADTALLTKNFAAVAAAKVVVKAKVNEKGHLYDAVGKEEIVAAIKEAAGVAIDTDSIVLAKPLKEAGTFDIGLSSGDISGTFSLAIEAAE